MSSKNKNQFHEIDQKWQSRWEKNSPYKALNPGDPGFDPQKKTYYVLDMFPYPSGSGLHVGHASGYIGTDIIARKKRMEGFNVLHPMGWDAFGLPAEQYALQTGQNPRTTTDVNSTNFRQQMKKMALSYDWSREIDTSKPDYYQWTQWIFLQLFKKGLVYRKEMYVWWCEDLKTVLANEEVINGRSERGNFPCERRPLTQWVFKITEYAERLLSDLDLLDWPASIKKQQADWIGKSNGAEIDFQIFGSKNKIKVFTTRPDTLFGVSALVLAPEHPLVASLIADSHRSNVQSYLKKSSAKSDRERKADVDDVSGEFLGTYVEHPLLENQKIPIWIADYVLVDYGTGAVMSVPAHDERDFKLAKKCQLPILPVVKKNLEEVPSTATCFDGDGILIRSGRFDGLTSEQARIQITQALEEKKLGQAKVSYKIRDWIFSRQRYWGEPFPVSFNQAGVPVPVQESELPVLLPDMKDFSPSADGSAPLARLEDWVEYLDPQTGEKKFRSTDTMPGWAGSCWYYLRFMDPKNPDQFVSDQAKNYWHQVDLYVGGAAHAVMHLLYARFWHKALFDLGLVPTPEPFKKLFNQGMVTAYAFKDPTGRLIPSDEVQQLGPNKYAHKTTGVAAEKIIAKMAKSLRNVVNPDDVIAERGCDTFRLYEMFMGPLDSEKPWADEGISGCEKFLKRVLIYFLQENGETKPEMTADAPAANAVDRSLNKCLKRIDESFENFNFNTAVAALMECMNELMTVAAAGAGKQKNWMNQSQAEFFLKMLFPLAPHVASELWEKLGHAQGLDFASWPKLDAAKLVDTQFELVLQINGKIRKKVMVAMTIDQAGAMELAHSQLQEFLQGKSIRKIIFVPQRLLNLVVS